MRKGSVNTLPFGGVMKYVLALMSLIGLSGAFADDMSERVQAALELDESTEIIATLTRDAMRGNLKAAHELGLMYLEGRHVERDPAKARAMFETAGERILYRDRYKRGYAKSQFELGRMIEQGIGGARDSESAADWYERAAEQGHAPAQVALARIYADESTSPSGFDVAFFWASLAVRAYGLDASDQAEAQRILETASARVSRTEAASLRRKAASWTPVLFADSD